MALTCTFLKTNEHLFIYLTVYLINCLWRNVHSNPLPIFSLGLGCYKISLYILDTDPLSEMGFAKCFLSVLGSLFLSVSIYLFMLLLCFIVNVQEAIAQPGATQICSCVFESYAPGSFGL